MPRPAKVQEALQSSIRSSTYSREMQNYVNSSLQSDPSTQIYGRESVVRDDSPSLVRQPASLGYRTTYNNSPFLQKKKEYSDRLQDVHMGWRSRPKTKTLMQRATTSQSTQDNCDLEAVYSKSNLFSAQQHTRVRPQRQLLAKMLTRKSEGCDL